ncbi:MAG: glycosyltransferase family 2 protein [Alistipes sp.]|nr:glycosyltransferase family 2 protein [Alistipes sp.]MBQ3082485.1 glycosyltransferase family 2 protein [Alistipes sp.]
MSVKFSVVIPLYNKSRSIAATLQSVAAQRYAPHEIIVVDDGSTDESQAVVRALNIPSLRLICQPNGGVSRARNRGIEAASGDYIALLDADDLWEEGFLEEITALIADYPACGLYCTAFRVVAENGLFDAPCPSERGVVEHFFRDSAHRYIAIPSTAVIPRTTLNEVGLFPAGMKIGEDLHLWIRIARRYRVAFSPRRLVRYSRVAENRSTSIYTPEQCDTSFEALYNPEAPLDEREFVARAALGKALILSAKGDTEAGQRAIRTFGFTKTYRRTLRKLQLLNSLPVGWRQPLLDGYNWLAWRLAKKGL